MRPGAGTPPATAALAWAFALAGGLALAGCGVGARTVPGPTANPVAVQSVSVAIALTRSQMEGVLRPAGFGLIEPRVPFRPAESPSLMEAPRGVYQAILPDDPEHGFIVVYELPDAGAAFAAGTELAAYLASGPGRVQFPPDSRHVIRQVGTTLVVFSWSPASSPDPRTPELANAIASLGQSIEVVR